MSFKSNEAGYGGVAKTIHWFSAVCILLLLGSGFKAGSAVDSVEKIEILKFHIPLGLMMLFLTVFRIIWWWCFDTKPASSESNPSWQDFSAKAVHLLFYVIIIGMAASGIGMLVLSNAGLLIFGSSYGILPDFNLYPPRLPHGVGARLLVFLFVLHAGAAFYHHFIKRDQTLKRMWFGYGEKI